MKAQDIIYKDISKLTDGLLTDVSTLVIALIVLMFLVTGINKLLLFFNNFSNGNRLTESKKLPSEQEDTDGGLTGQNYRGLFK